MQKYVMLNLMTLGYSLRHITFKGLYVEKVAACVTLATEIHKQILTSTAIGQTSPNGNGSSMAPGHGWPVI